MNIRKRIETAATDFTPSERKLATVLLSDYPYAGLIKMQELADRAEISQPSISRFVIKIGLSGFPELQKHLVSELREGDRSPVEIHATSEQIKGGYLNGFLRLASEQMASAGQAVTESQFEQICGLLADPKRAIYAVGGRISDTIAQHLSFHLRQARERVYHLPLDPEVWPEYLLRMKQGDVFFLVDFRRYQKNLWQLAKQAQAQKVQVVLMTDHWLSPATRHASEVLVVPIETGTIWDSYAPALALTEALVTRVAEKTWPQTRKRIEAWDTMRDGFKERTHGQSDTG